MKRKLLEACLWVAAAIFSVATAFVLAGCETSRITGSGIIVAPPAGHAQFCIDNPKHEVCPK